MTEVREKVRKNHTESQIQRDEDVRLPDSDKKQDSILFAVEQIRQVVHRYADKEAKKKGLSLKDVAPPSLAI